MKKILFVFSVLFCSSLVAFADCITGFACSIDELVQKEKLQQTKNIEVIKKHFNKSNSYKNYLAMNKNEIMYKDLFLFNTVL